MNENWSEVIRYQREKVVHALVYKDDEAVKLEALLLEAILLLTDNSSLEPDLNIPEYFDFLAKLKVALSA